MKNTIDLRIENALEILRERLEKSDSPQATSEALAINALTAAQVELERTRGLFTRAARTAAGMLDAMKGHTDGRQAALARLGLEAIASLEATR